jgi:aminopeptidase N
MKNAASNTSVEFRETGKFEANKAHHAHKGGADNSQSVSLKSVGQSILPQTIVKRLALSESGFVFDPVSGQSFTVNESGLAVLRLAQSGSELSQILEQLAQQFEATADEIKRDTLDFAERLKEFFK